jgi:hypothetical protein
VLYVIAGDGTGNKTEIIGSLEDLMAKAVEAEQEFWFAVQPGDPATTKYIVAWLKNKDVYFDSVGTKIVGAKEQRAADPEGLIEFMQEFAEDGVELLALFVDVDNDVEEDAPLMAQVEAAVTAGFTVRLLNAQMTKISFAEDDAEEVEEEQTGTLADDGEEDEEQVEEAQQFTEADLKKMTVPELTALAKGQGIDVKAVGKGKADLIAAILAQQEEPLADEEADEDDTALDAALAADEDPDDGYTVSTNGSASPLIKEILRAFGEALIAASR